MNNLYTFGPIYKDVKGYNIKLGNSNYHHLFGGISWKVIDEDQSFDGPALLLSLDLNDPYIETLKNPKLTELPLCSYLNCNAWEGEQLFKIIPEKKEVHLIEKEIDNPEAVMEEDKLPNSLPEKSVYLEEVQSNESPVDEDSYWNACDELLGGDKFIRILQPVWLQDAEEHNCTCGKPMSFVACIGYENYEISDGFIGDKPFFLGEAALYYFICHDCLIIKSTSQSS